MPRRSSGASNLSHLASCADGGWCDRPGDRTALRCARRENDVEHHLHQASMSIRRRVALSCCGSFRIDRSRQASSCRNSACPDSWPGKGLSACRLRSAVLNEMERSATRRLPELEQVATPARRGIMPPRREDGTTNEARPSKLRALWRNKIARQTLFPHLITAAKADGRATS